MKYSNSSFFLQERNERKMFLEGLNTEHGFSSSNVN